MHHCSRMVRMTALHSPRSVFLSFDHLIIVIRPRGNNQELKKITVVDFRGQFLREMFSKSCSCYIIDICQLGVCIL